MIIRVHKDGDFCLLRLPIQCDRCSCVSIIVPWRQDQEILCVMCGISLGVVDGVIVGME